MKKLLSIMLIIATMCSLLGGFAVLAADEYVKGDLLINGDFELLGTSYTTWAGHGALSTDSVHGGEKALQQKGNEQKVVLRKLLPGYVIVKMIMTDDTWYVIRNTRGVTGFVGPGSKPVPLTDDEVFAMGIERKTVEVNFSVGSSVRVTGGAFSDFVGVVDEINTEKQLVRVIVSMFGRETPVELDFSQIEVLD